MRATPLRATGTVGAAALVLGLLVSAPAADAAPSPTATVVINEVYGGGGNSGATFTRDFIELVNVGTATVNLDQWSVQYGSAAGTSAFQVTSLAGTVLPAGASLVVGEAAGAGGTADVPVDISGSIAMSGSGGKVALVSAPTALAGCGADCSALPQVVDFVGWGAANDYAGSAPAPATTNATSVSRDGAHTNTADNRADLALSNPPTPLACGTACDAGSQPPEVEPVTIAEIQGRGSASPRSGATVTTRGVVTAAYPTGGFHGFFIQTPGTGGLRDLTAASDGLFVFQSGSGALDPDATIGRYVEVTGKVSEYGGLTELTAAPADITDAGADFVPVTPVTNAWPRTDAERESVEGMLYRPTGAYTVTNTYATNQYGEVGLAVGTTPLMQPTELAAPRSAEATAIAADNAARAVTLDDGASTNFLASSYSTTACEPRPTPCLLNGDLTPAYVSNTAPVRVAAPVTFTAPVVVDYRFNLWRLQPTGQVVGPDNAMSPVTFTNTRTPAPDANDLAQNGTPDLTVASFNVLNFFTTLGSVTAGCEAYRDRDGDGNNVSGGCLPRGAWDSADLQRQREKIVSAVNALGADVVGLMEIENSAALGEPTDEALAALVAALNATAGAGTWAYVPSSTQLPPAAEQDVITNAIIYRPANVMRVGQSMALGDQSGPGQAFGNAREPIAQVFRKKTGPGDKFLFVVNHFKSKGSAGPFPGDEDSGDGQGSSVTSRTLQAQALRDWIPTALAPTSTRAVVMAGDYNSYTEEDPLEVLYRAGYTDVGSAFDRTSWSYSFSGLSGSLDHILVNGAALAMSTGADHWNINSGESVALEYSRFNYHGTTFHDPGPYRSSDHDPVVLGLRASVK